MSILDCSLEASNPLQNSHEARSIKASTAWSNPKQVMQRGCGSTQAIAEPQLVHLFILVPGCTLGRGPVGLARRLAIEEKVGAKKHR